MDNGHSKEEKDRIREFIDNLESLRSLGDPDAEYIEELIENYGLPSDDFCKKAFIAIRKEMMTTEKKLPEPFISYLRVFCMIL